METSQNLRNYPVLEGVMQGGSLPGFLAGCAATCERLNGLAAGPDPRLAERAKAAMTAYGHTMTLLRRLATEAASER